MLLPCCLLACLAPEEILRTGSSDQHPVGKIFGRQTRTVESNVCFESNLRFAAWTLLQQHCAFLLRPACMHACHGRCIEVGMIAGTRLWPAAPAMGPAGLAGSIVGDPTAPLRAVDVHARKSARGPP